jgi:hypothetical protein
MNEQTELEFLRYPVGRFKIPESFTTNEKEQWIRQIENLPSLLRMVTENLSDEQLDTPYREDGWTIRQVVHHLVDSHINSYCRFKLALTEETPAIRPYYEDRWAKLQDGSKGPVELSLSLLESLHRRWVYFLQRMDESDWDRKFFHPESKREFSLKIILALYAWHCDHHLHHITNLKKRKGWK